LYQYKSAPLAVNSPRICCSSRHAAKIRPISVESAPRVENSPHICWSSRHAAKICPISVEIRATHRKLAPYQSESAPLPQLARFISINTAQKNISKWMISVNEMLLNHSLFYFLFIKIHQINTNTN